MEVGRKVGSGEEKLGTNKEELDNRKTLAVDCS
jgi:hypothetical protein